MKGWPLIETLLVLLAANAIVGLVAVACSIGDIASVAHNLGSEDNSS